MCDLSLPTRDGILAPCTGSMESTTGPPGKSPGFLTVKGSRRKRKGMRRAGCVGNGRGPGTRNRQSVSPGTHWEPPEQMTQGGVWF